MKMISKPNAASANRHVHRKATGPQQPRAQRPEGNVSRPPGSAEKKPAVSAKIIDIGAEVSKTLKKAGRSAEQ
jgi:hypothetical protein